MFSIIGILVVFGAVVAGYLMEHGNLRVLLQPAELVIIGGASVGTVLVANPLHILKKIVSGVTGVFTGSKFGKQVYIDSLKTMYELVNRARKDGLMALEGDVEEPEKSAILSKNATFMKNHHVCDFVCDTLRMAVTGIDAFDLDQVLDLDMEVHHHDSEQPTTALITMADSLPGLGIVAAVAMMALFIVLWLLNSSKQIQVAVGGYFKDPTGTSKQVGSNMQGSGESFALTKDDMPKLREELQKTVRQLDNFDSLKDHIEMTVTAEGLRIELTESASGTFFESGNSAPTQNGREMLIALAHEVGKLPNKISFEGHTDAKPFARDSNYGNWELSADRANAARRLMQQNGVKDDQVAQIRGYADQQLRKADSPQDPTNRRISLIIECIIKDPATDAQKITETA